MEKEGAALVDQPRLTAARRGISQNMRLISAGIGEWFRRFRKTARPICSPT